MINYQDLGAGPYVGLMKEVWCLKLVIQHAVLLMMDVFLWSMDYVMPKWLFETVLLLGSRDHMVVPPRNNSLSYMQHMMFANEDRV